VLAKAINVKNTSAY